MNRPTISDEYRLEQKKLHENPRYGVASLDFAPLVRALLVAGGCTSLADYGAGKCKLKEALGLQDGGILGYYPYDPAFPEYGPPRPADLVTCIDVLEHVEPELLDACLAELSSVTRQLALMTIHTGPASKVLSDGRNAHLLQETPSWWLQRLERHFDVLHVQQVPKGFFVIACPPGGYRDIAARMDVAAISRAAAGFTPRKKRNRVQRWGYRLFNSWSNMMLPFRLGRASAPASAPPATPAQAGLPGSTRT